MQWREYLLKCEGYRKKLERESKNKWDEIRIITYMIHAHMANKPKRFEQWLNDSKGGNQIERLKQKLEAHKARHGE